MAWVATPVKIWLPVGDPIVMSHGEHVNDIVLIRDFR